MPPTIALSLEDYLPVLLTLFALVWLARMIFSMDHQSGYVAVFGLIFVVLGGVLKATSKLLWAVTGDQITWMENSLFLLMAPGFAFLAWAVWSGQRRLFRDIQPKYVLQVPVVFLVLIGGGTLYFRTSTQGGIWFLVLLSLVVLMSNLMLVLLIRHAWIYQRRDTALLFLLYLVITLVLNGMARAPSTSVGMVWVKQLVNTAAAAILAVGSWQLLQETRQIPRLEEKRSPSPGKIA